MAKKKILFVYYTMMLGGSTTSLLSLLESMDYDKYDVDLLLYRNEGPLFNAIPKGVNILNQASFDVSRSQKNLLKKYFLLLKSGYLFKGILKNVKYKREFGFSTQIAAEAQVDLFSNDYSGKVYDVAVGFLEIWPDKFVVSDKVSAKKKIGWNHMDFGKSHYIPELEFDCFSKFDTVISVSEECEKHNRALFNLKDSRYLPNILSAEIIRSRAKELPDKSDEFYEIWRKFTSTKIITVCRLHNDSKALERAVCAAFELKKNGVDFLWFVLGDGSDKLLLENLISEKGVTDRFILIGSRINPYPFMALADLFVLTSRHEGKPIVITESMMLGIPALVTNYSSASEQIRNGVDGIIVPNEDSAIFDPLYDLVTNKGKLNYLRQNIPQTLGNKNDIKLYDALFNE